MINLKFKNNLKPFLDKLRSQPDNVKKIILWTIVAVAAVAMLVFWWFFIFQKSLANLSKENLMKGFNTQELQDKMKNIPGVEAPKASSDQVKQLEEKIKELEKTATSDNNLK